MPHDLAPPPRAATGQTQLPLSRVRKVIALDPDINLCSSNAAFVITLATELFLQHLATEGHNMVKLDRKPRKNLQYRDLASAVSRIDRLEFLEDVIPNTVPYGKIKNDAARARKAFTGEATVASMFGAVAANGGGGSGGVGGDGAADTSTVADTTSTKNGGTAKSKKARSSGGAPTAISALMTDSAAAAAEEAGPGKKRQQVLPFSILNGDEEGANASFMRMRGGSGGGAGDETSDGVDSGVKAAAALAQAAAASGSSPASKSTRRVSAASGMAVDDAGPDAQLEQDMRRVNDDDNNNGATGGNAPRARAGRGRHSSDVQMQDS